MRLHHLLALALGLAFSSPSLWLPNLWLSFVVPGIVLGALQIVALGNWGRKETFFKFTDYIYYLLLGAVVAIGSTVVLRVDEARLVDAQVELRSLETAIASADQDLPRMRTEQEALQRNLKTADKDFVATCRAQQMLSRLKPNDKRGVETPRIDLCFGYFALEGRALQLPSEIARLQDSRSKAQARLEELQRQYPSDATGVKVSAEAQNAQREFEVRWLTLLALLGAAIKLGKTTCSLCPLPR